MSKKNLCIVYTFLSIIMNYRCINTIRDENEHFLQPYTPNLLRIFVSRWIKLYVHIANEIVYWKSEALLQNKFCSSMVQIIYYHLMLVKLCHVWSDIAVPFRQHMYGKAHKLRVFSPACSTGTTVTAAYVVRAQPWPVTAEQRLALNDTKLSV